MSQRQSNPVRKSPLLLLSLWMGLGGLMSPTVYAQDAALEIAPERVTPATEPIPSEPAPEVVLPAFDPEPQPTAVSPAPEAIAPEPEPAIPEASTPEPELNIPPAATGAPAVPEQVQSDSYIDTQDYSVGATEPYTPPNEVVVNERSSGCQAVVSADVASSLCGPPPALQRYSAPNPIAEQAPAWSDRWAANSDRWQGSESVASAQTVQESLNYSAVVPHNLAIKPLTGANPLKWIMQNGERMIFPLPIPVDITSAFGWRNHPITGEWRFHSGTDLGAPMGTPVLAAYSGKVSLAEMLGGYGLSILLDHSQGQQETRYAHLSEIYVKPGQWVQQGTVIGLVGSTGNSTGPHLHFEALQTLPDGTTVAVDPGSELQTTLTQLAQMLQTARLTAQKPVMPAQTQNQQNQS